ncbi:TIR domain-containing protein [Pseudorhodoplanes sp.]|uniref:TIR domain-containing protein n=1 Tax=Pseudorhodoplanes sp. TaxID=1934341 RepID=UPI003D0DE83D
MKKVYYSFYYDEDASRVQQVVNMGVVEGQQILSGQKWEEVKKKGDQAVKDWIAKEMKGKECLVALVGTNTSKRPWVTYEIKKAWDDGLGVVGVRIHGLKDLNTQKTSARGNSPFSDIIALYDPPGADSKAVYASISNNIEALVAKAKRKPR